MRASDLPAAAPHTASQHPISLSSTGPVTCGSVERREVPRCTPNGPTIDGKDGVAGSIPAGGSTQALTSAKRWLPWRLMRHLPSREPIPCWDAIRLVGRPAVLSIPLTGVVAWLPDRFRPGHGLRSGPRTHPWTTGKGLMSGRLEPRGGSKRCPLGLGLSGGLWPRRRRNRRDSQDGGLRGSLAGVEAGRCERPRPWGVRDG
jgi:hypothetical protein